LILWLFLLSDYLTQLPTVSSKKNKPTPACPYYYDLEQITTIDGVRTLVCKNKYDLGKKNDIIHIPLDSSGSMNTNKACQIANQYSVLLNNCYVNDS